MKNVLFLLLIFAGHAFAGDVERLLGNYRQIETVSCKIRRTVDGAAGPVRFISRVYWQNGNKLHVDNLTPLPRRIISDGDRFYSYAQGDPKGFSRPVSELSEPMMLSLRKIPGTAMEHLLLLEGVPEETLAETNGLRRVGYSSQNRYVVLGMDSVGRLTHLDFFKTRAMNEQIAAYEYSDFSEVLPSVWIPMRYQARLNAADKTAVTETLKIDEFSVNSPVAVSLFDSSIFFDNKVDFADSFSEIYQ